MVATSIGKTPHDYSSPSSSVRLNDTKVVLYLHSDHQSESEPHTGSIPTDVSLNKSGLEEVKKDNTTQQRNQKRHQHNTTNQTKVKRHKARTDSDQWHIYTDRRREEPAGPQQESFQPVSTSRSVGGLVGWLVWKSPSLTTIGCCEKQRVYIRFAVYVCLNGGCVHCAVFMGVGCVCLHLLCWTTIQNTTMLILSKIVVVVVVVVVTVPLASATVATKPLHATERRRRTAPRASQPDRVFMVLSSSLSSSSPCAKRMLWVGIAQQ